MSPILGASTLLDRQSEKRSDREYIEKLRGAQDTRFLVLAGGKPVVDVNEDRSQARIRWFERSTIDELKIPVADSIFLGVDKTGEGKKGAARFALPITEHFARHVKGGSEHLNPFVDLRSLASQGNMSPEELSLIGQATALANWHHNTKCCGRCGGSMSSKEGGWKRECWACKHHEFPRMDPVVLMAITDGEKLVLAHEERFPAKMYSVLGGFVEPGDDFIHAVRREAHEEVGVDVQKVSFVGAQQWPFEHSLLLGCVAHVENCELKVNTDEIADARWFSRDDIKLMVEGKHPDALWVPGCHSMAYKLIQDFIEGNV